MTYELTPKALRLKTEPFDFENPPIDPQELFIKLRDTMVKHNGLGLSANQVGLPWSVFVMGNPRAPEEVLGFFNPQILDYMGDSVSLDEGCLSFPGLIVPVPRREGIRYRATNYEGNTDSGVFQGMSSRIFQHETDHLNGSIFLDRISRLKKDMALRKLKKSLSNKVET